MPIYEYQCPQCDHKFDRLQKIDAPREIPCVACDCLHAIRLTSMPSFRLKGSGWYETDFKSSNQKNLAGEQKAGSKENKKTDKPDNKGSTSQKDKHSVTST